MSSTTDAGRAIARRTALGMGQLRADMRDYWQHARRQYVNLILGALIGVLAFAASLTGLTLPAWVFWILAIAFLVVAQFRTYRDVRRDLDQLRRAVSEREARRLRLSGAGDLNDEDCFVWELLPSLPGSKPLITQRTLTNCTLRGPAMVTFLGSTSVVAGSMGEGNIDSILHETTLGEKQGVIGFLNCTLTRCNLIGIGYFGPKDLMEKIRHGTVLV
jgi:hypothetical protein